MQFANQISAFAVAAICQIIVSCGQNVQSPVKNKGNGSNSSTNTQKIFEQDLVLSKASRSISETPMQDLQSTSNSSNPTIFTDSNKNIANMNKTPVFSSAFSSNNGGLFDYSNDNNLAISTPSWSSPSSTSSYSSTFRTPSYGYSTPEINNSPSSFGNLCTFQQIQEAIATGRYCENGIIKGNPIMGNKNKNSVPDYCQPTGNPFIDGPKGMLGDFGGCPNLSRL